MKVRIKYFGQLREMAGVEEEAGEPSEGNDLKAVLEERARSHGDDFRRVIFNRGGRLRPSVMILVNGDPVDKARPPKLEDGDEITVLAAIAGG